MNWKLLIQLTFNKQIETVSYAFQKESVNQWRGLIARAWAPIHIFVLDLYFLWFIAINRHLISYTFNLPNGNAQFTYIRV